ERGQLRTQVELRLGDRLGERGLRTAPAEVDAATDRRAGSAFEELRYGRRVDQHQVAERGGLGGVDEEVRPADRGEGRVPEGKACDELGQAAGAPARVRAHGEDGLACGKQLAADRRDAGAAAVDQWTRGDDGLPGGGGR